MQGHDIFSYINSFHKFLNNYVYKMKLSNPVVESYNILFGKFEGGIGFPKCGGPLNSTRAVLLNHETSKISTNRIWMKSSLWVFKIRGFEGGIWLPKHGGSHNSTGVEL
jgi:hypothetical protein